MTKLINDFYFTAITLTPLMLFSIIFWDNIALYSVMALALVLSTLVIELALNKKYFLQEKSKKMSLTIVPINIAVFAMFAIFVF